MQGSMHTKLKGLAGWLGLRSLILARSVVQRKSEQSVDNTPQLLLGQTFSWPLGVESDGPSEAGAPVEQQDAGDDDQVQASDSGT